jgi:hypothetical protein
MFIFLTILVNAHEEENDALRIDEYLTQSSIKYLIIASIITALLLIVASLHKNKSENFKKFVFSSIVIVVTLSTLYLAGTTVYINVISETKGPIHWHADFEIWNCNNKIDLIDSKGITNKVGSPLLHEHGDNRIHVEGTVLDKKNVNLHKFFDVIGGFLKKGYLKVPANGEALELNDGDLCNNNPGKLQVFVYKIITPNPYSEKVLEYKQTKLDDFENYVLSSYTDIPPGDCIIIEFDENKDKTDKICERYKAAIEENKLIEVEDGG